MLLLQRKFDWTLGYKQGNIQIAAMKCSLGNNIVRVLSGGIENRRTVEFIN